MSAKLDPQAHKQMIAAYTTERPHYVTYAKAIERVLKRACSVSIPEAIVQSRPKGVSSFAEKCVRKFEKYGLEPLKKMTDLCGARVIVHTLEQVKAVRMFIEHNFEIIERDDKGLLLGETTFGYRDMHYLVKLLPDRAKRIGFADDEIDTIGQRIAEVQVRSVVQHAWADILHDRMYKAPLRLSSEAKRTGALLAAIMEDGDRSFNDLALEIDGMTANYAAYAGRKHVEAEIEVQQQILTSDPRPAAALQLARLQGSCGRYDKVVTLLTPFADTQEALRPDLLVELGHALCRVERDQPTSSDYLQGQAYLDEVIQHCEEDDLTAVPNLRKRKSLLAKAHARLAWTWEALSKNAGKARTHYRLARETEPANPYHLANQLGFEIYCARSDAMIHSMKTAIRQAVDTCRQHTLARTELPYALFTAGRLHLLLGEPAEALAWYGRGLRYLFDGISCVCPRILDDEIQWIQRIDFGDTETINEHQWIERLITLARSYNDTKKKDKTAPPLKVLIIAGGAAGMSDSLLTKITPLVQKTLEGFTGTVISGGTQSGLPGCVGQQSSLLKKQGKKDFELVGYFPEYLPQDAPKDEANYDRLIPIKGDKGFSASQILKIWEDLQTQGIKPDEVLLLGIGGGSLAAVEYRMALSLGARAAIVQKTGRAADAILTDPVWTSIPSLLILPLDVASAQALTSVPTQTYDDSKLTEMAQAFHNQYVANNTKKLPDTLRPWDDLPETYQLANKEQAGYAVEILKAAGFKVQPVTESPKVFTDLTKKEIETMAELEHGRWNVERLNNGWRPGETRDDENKIHNYLIPWDQLPEEIKQYDRWAVEAFPEILAKAGLEVSR